MHTNTLKTLQSKCDQFEPAFMSINILG